MKTNLFKLVFVMLLGITVLGSCKKDDKEPEPVTPEITLSAPADGATFNMAAAENATGITFTWTKDVQVTDYLLKVSTEQTFATTVVSVSGNQNSYLWTSTEIEAKLVELSVDYESSKTLYWTVVSAKLDQEADTETRSFTITRKQHPPKYGEWLFEDPANFGKATVGNDLELKWWSAGGIAESEMFNPVAGVSGSDQAVRLHNYGWFIARHGITPIGTDTHINTYTILWDVNIRTPATLAYGWMTTDVNHNTPTYHGDVRIISLSIENPNDEGLTGGNISGIQNMWSVTSSDDLDDYHFPSNQWKRFILRVDLENQVMEAFVDGDIKAKTIDAMKGSLIPNNCIWAWLPEGVVLFPPHGGGGSHEALRVDVSRITIWDYCLTPTEIAALGAAGAPTDIGNN
ncbi:MAG: SusE domain-containing protein [Prevotellaceae bacterium]|jgi:hypothetical protein|nr:SusE domain-containing protein [Prevotellaceae bacterium]